MRVSKEDFFAIQQKVGFIPFEQTRVWLDSSGLEKLCKIIYLVDSDKNPTIACWGRETSRRFFGRKLMIDGLAYSPEIQHKKLTEFFTDITTMGYNTIEISDICKYNPNFEIGIRRAGFVRPWGLELCPMSMIVHLQEDFNFARNWRKNVKKSREAENQFEYVEHPSLEDAKHYVELFGALKERKGITYQLLPEEIHQLLQGGYDLFFVKSKDGKYLSGRIEYPYGDLVYDTYAATCAEGIKTGAAYQIQEDIFYFYRERGYLRFDYGRIPPSKDHMDNIYLAKSYSGGEPIGYNGQWIYFTSRKKYALMVAYMRVLHKSKIY